MPVVRHLARFPVKSMLGEELSSVAVTERGLVGDRAYALVDRSDGLVASAKHPRKWGRLLECRARFTDEARDGRPVPPVAIDLPDGSTVRSDEADVDAVLSRFLGREVALAGVAPDAPRIEEVWPAIDGLAPTELIDSTRVADEDGEPVSELPLGFASPPGTFFDLSPLHLLTTATLDALRGHRPEATYDWRRYRPNLVVETDATGFAENGWAGARLVVGEALLRITMPTMRCVMTTLAQEELPVDRATLRGIAETNRLELPGMGTFACAGVYGEVVQGGEIRVGDPVTVEPGD